MRRDHTAPPRSTVILGLVGLSLAALAVVFAACGGAPAEHPPVADAGALPGCDDGAPVIDDCYVGHFFADCGGDDGPRFACTLAGQCRWFTGGCVADGYLASQCPPDDVCCVDGRPFPLGAETRPAAVASLLYGFGLQPWDRDRAMDVDVVVDSALQRSVALIRCERDSVEVAEGPCLGGGTSLSSQIILEDTLYTVLAFPALTGEAVAIEVDLAAPAAGGEPRARVCSIRFSSEVSDTCEPDASVACATTGTVTLGHIPAPGEDVEELPLTSVVELDNGLVVRAGF